MKEGFIYSVVRFPAPWPPLVPSVLFSREDSGSTQELQCNPDGSIRFWVRERDTIIADVTTQPLRISGTGFLLLGVKWTEESATVYLNGTNVKDSATAAGEILTIATRTHPPQTQTSFQDPQASSACREWMEWRKHRYAGPKLSPKENRRLKSLPEQLLELGRAQQSLADLLNLIQQGHTHLLGHLATELRALIYWNGKNYSPLLLRVAGRLALPLPMFFMVYREPPISPKTQLHLRQPSPSLFRTLPGESLGDLQEWLLQPVLRAELQRFRHGNAVREEVTLTVKDVVLSLATTLGAAHYDEDVPDSLEALYNIRGPLGDAASQILVDVVLMVVAMCEFVIQHARIQKVIQ
jgi:hypothetical protein